MIFLPILIGCSPSSSDDFLREGEALSRRVIKRLNAIETQEELMRAESQLKKDFEAYVDLIIQAREYQKKHPNLVATERSGDFSVSEQLKEALRRIYAFEGGREILERSQQEALVRLDAYDNSRGRYRKF
jgi:hypothetical protein